MAIDCPPHCFSKTEDIMAPIAIDTAGQLPREAYTIPEFCEAHRISQSMYFKLRNAGLGPREMRAMRKVMISVEAAQEWRRAREIAARAVSDRAA
jgi:hypothetical protein